MNALIHRDYLEPGSVYVRHSRRQMVISSPGGFIGGITPQNILHAEPKARNRLLAEIFQKLGLVERAGIGRERIFRPMLAYGKRAPTYEANDHTVKLTVYDGSFDDVLAAFVAKREKEGRSFDLDELLLLSYLREHSEIETRTAAQVCQLPDARMRDRLDQICLRRDSWLEKRGRKKGVTYHLSKWVAAEFMGRGVYARSRDIDRIRWPELIHQHVETYGSIGNAECRELLNLGNSPSARVTVSRLLSKQEFLEPYGNSRRKRRYKLKRESEGKPS